MKRKIVAALIFGFCALFTEEEAKNLLKKVGKVSDRDFRLFLRCRGALIANAFFQDDFKLKT